MTKHDAERLHQLIFRHMRYTNSAKAKLILDNWDTYLPKFKKVMPVDYKKALAEMARQQAADPDRLCRARDRSARAEGEEGEEGQGEGGGVRWTAVVSWAELFAKPNDPWLVA